MSDTVEYLSFSLWFISLSKIPQGPSILLQMAGFYSFSWLNSIPLYIYHIFIHSSVDGHLGCFHLSFILKYPRSPHMNLNSQTSRLLLEITSNPIHILTSLAIAFHQLLGLKGIGWLHRGLSPTLGSTFYQVPWCLLLVSCLSVGSPPDSGDTVWSMWLPSWPVSRELGSLVEWEGSLEEKIKGQVVLDFSGYNARWSNFLGPFLTGTPLGYQEAELRSCT